MPTRFTTPLPWLLGSTDPEREKRNEDARKQAEERERLEALPPLCIIHTVHGTFAKDADWVEPGSSMGYILRRELGWRVKIIPYRWSGQNNVVAREKAAVDFQQHLWKKLEEFDSQKHFIIAHSHGGNVAFMAVNSPQLAAKISGVVTLATPFLSAQAKDSEELIDPGTGFFAGLFAGWTILFAGFYQGIGWALWPWAVGACFGTVALLFLGWSIMNQMQGHAKRVAASMWPTALKPSQVTIVRMQGDEASAGITGARLAGHAADLLWHTATSGLFKRLNSLLQIVDYGGSRSFNEAWKQTFTKGDAYKPVTTEKTDFKKNVSQAVIQTLPAFILQAFEKGDPATKLTLLLLMGLYALPAAFAVGTVLLGVPFAFLSSISLVTCGLSLPLAGPYLELHAETSPPGTWSVTHFDSDPGSRGLWHSQAHQSLNVQVFVAKWIHERTSVPPATTALG